MSDQLIPRKSETSSFLDRVVAFGVHHKILYPARRQQLSAAMAELHSPLCRKFGMNPEATGDALKVCQYMANLLSIELEMKSGSNLEFSTSILFGEDPRQLCESALQRIDRLRLNFLDYEHRRVEHFRDKSSEGTLIVAYAHDPVSELAIGLVPRDQYTNPWLPALALISCASDIARIEMQVSAYQQELGASRKHLPWHRLVSSYGLHAVPFHGIQVKADITLDMMLTTLAVTLQMKGQGAGQPYISWKNLQKFASKLDTREFLDAARAAVRNYVNGLPTVPAKEEKDLLVRMWDQWLGRLCLFLPAERYRHSDLGSWKDTVIFTTQDQGRAKRSPFARHEIIRDLQDGIPDMVEMVRPGFMKYALEQFPWGKRPTEDAILIGRLEEDYAPAQIIRRIPLNAYVAGLVLGVWDAWNPADKRRLVRRLLKEGTAEFWKKMVPHIATLEGPVENSSDPAGKRLLKLIREKKNR